MSRLSLHPYRQQSLLAACTTSARTAAPVRPEPGIAAEVLFDLRADDVLFAGLAAARAKLLLPLHNPAEGRFLAVLLAESEHVRRSRNAAFEAVMAEEREASAERCARIAADAWIDEADGTAMADNVDAVLDAVAARPELLADSGLGADVLALALADLDELLAPPLPGDDWFANLRAVLPLTEAMLNGQVA